MANKPAKTSAQRGVPSNVTYVTGWTTTSRPRSTGLWSIPNGTRHEKRASATNKQASCWRLIHLALPICFAALLALTLTGCHATHVEKPLTQGLPDDPTSAQLEFWHGLEGRPVTCNDEAFHGLLLFADGKDESPGYPARVATLKLRKWLPAGFDRPADESVQRGTIAVALVQVLKIHGGWALSLLGPTPRYATRKLVYMDLFPPSSPEQAFSGSEFVGIIARAEDYQAGDHGTAPATELNAK